MTGRRESERVAAETEECRFALGCDAAQRTATIHRALTPSRSAGAAVCCDASRRDANKRARRTAALALTNRSGVPARSGKPAVARSTRSHSRAVWGEWDRLRPLRRRDFADYAAGVFLVSEITRTVPHLFFGATPVVEGRQRVRAELTGEFIRSSRNAPLHLKQIAFHFKLIFVWEHWGTQS